MTQVTFKPQEFLLLGIALDSSQQLQVIHNTTVGASCRANNENFTSTNSISTSIYLVFQHYLWRWTNTINKWFTVWLILYHLVFRKKIIFGHSNPSKFIHYKGILNADIFLSIWGSFACNIVVNHCDAMLTIWEVRVEVASLWSSSQVWRSFSS